MEVIQRISGMKSKSKKLRERGKTVGLVPTMGALHEGHLSLVRIMRERTDETVISIFVNPTQFGPGEDYEEYPRDVARDVDLLTNEGVKYIFIPDAGEIYHEPYHTWVTVDKLTEGLCGQSRPGHFKGVCTVVLKLFSIVRPHFAVFGEKDFQQLRVIEQMAKDLNMDTEIVRGPTVREESGLAMSSRNKYFTGEQREKASVLFKALSALRESWEKGEKDTEKLKRVASEILEKEPAVRLDYLEVVDEKTLRPIKKVKARTRVMLAAFLGETRLIDNIGL